MAGRGALRQTRRVLLAAAVTRIHVGGLPLAVMLLAEGATGSLATVGLAAGAVSIGVGATRPLQGRLVDRWGSRVLAHVGAAQIAVATVTVLRSPSMSSAEIVAWALALGLATPAVSVVTAATWAAMRRSGEQAAHYGADAALQDAAYLTGPLLAGLLMASVDARAALLALAVVAGVGSYALARSVASFAPGRRRDSSRRLRELVPLVRTFAGMSAVGVVFGAIGVATVAEVLDQGRDNLAGPITAALFAGGFLGDLLVAPRRVEEDLRRRLRSRLGAVVLATLPVALAPSLGMLIAAVVVLGIALAGAHVTVLVAIGARAGEGVRAEAYGWSGAVIRLGNALGVTGGGFVADGVGPQAAVLVATAGAACALALITAGRPPRRAPAVSEPAYAA